ncbi:unnamed protein product, partial [Vitis vinifera]
MPQRLPFQGRRSLRRRRIIIVGTVDNEELGEGSSSLKPTTPQEEKVQVQPEPVQAADATVEKEGEEEGVETKSKVPDKKLPKHVREMQEALARRKEAEERKKREEEERLRKEEEERRRQEELERLAEEAKRRKKEREKEKLLKKKQEGKLLTGKQKEEARRREAMRNQILANAGGLPISTGDAPTKRPKYQTKKVKSHPSQANGAAPSKPDENTEAKESLPETVSEKLEITNATEENGVEEEEDDEEWDAKSWDDAVTSIIENLRSPICCIMGHVPGLLVIDTPGHESFTNLRSRGSGLCDIAILVVDIMHGLEPQTIESLNLLKMRNTEFIVALNKVDRLYGWKVCRNSPIQKAMKQQSKDVQNEFNMRLTQIITQFKEQGLNTELYYKNKEMGETFSIVPTSAISGEGIPDLLLLLVHWTQKTMVEKLTYSSEVQCTVLEVKVVEGHGTTIDVVLVNGVLHEGDQIVVCGMQGPIVATIRALLTPHPMKELRVKGTYLHHKQIKAAQGIKITAQGLEHAIAGTGLYVVGPDDDLEDIKEAAMEDMKSVLSRIDKSGEGVYVQASTLGSLEALLEFLKSPAVSIPVSGIGIGPVHKKDVMKASVMLEKKKEYATILAFDVKVTPEARELADDMGVKIFIADIIYHLFDQFKAYIDNLKEEKKREAADEAVFPCVLKIMPNCIFNKKDPIVLGVDVLEGIAKVGTPICIPQRDFIDIGRIASIENNHKPVDIAKKGQRVAIKITSTNPEEQQKMFGRHFEMEDELVSHISRKSIDTLKANYRDDLSLDEWKLVVKLKTLFKIQ